MGTAARIWTMLAGAAASVALAASGTAAVAQTEPDTAGGEDVTVVVRLESEPSGPGTSADARHDAVRKEIAEAVGTETDDAGIADGEDYSSAIDGFTVTVPLEALDEIQNIDAVADAFVEREWTIDASELGQADPETETPDEEGSELELNAAGAGTTGAGRLVAFLDSGLLESHEAFGGSFPTSGLALTRQKSASVSKTIAAKGRAASGRWVSAKIPFVLDYAGGDNVVGPESGKTFSSHGTWVAALAAANAGKIRGAAPDAQIAMLKIGEANADGSVTLKDSAYLAALDDAVLIAPDVLNLSLGTPAGDMEAGNQANDTYAAAFAKLEKARIGVVAAAGNSYDAPREHIGVSASPSVDQPDTGIVSSPATYRQTLAVAASASNGTLPAFSSWGPVGDLRLKPEITATGVGVTSADAANATAYKSRLDGTSLAAPVVAGAAATLRQRLAESPEFARLSAADRDHVATRLLMGTADPLVDPATKTYYSPRRQGSGRVDLAGALASTVVPEVLGTAEPSRPKAELGDGTGTWTFQIRLANYGSKAATYRVSATALSEKVSSGAFSRASANWTGKGISVTPSASTLDVPAGSSATVTVRVKPETDFANWAAKNTPNGTFVDGYVILAPSSGDAGAQSLAIPFLAFYGDWAKASVFDADIWSGKALKSGIGLYSREQAGYIPLGANPYDASVTSSPTTWKGKVKAERAVVGRMAGTKWNAPSSRGVPDWIAARTALMRAASRLDYALIGPDGKEKQRWSKTDVRRSAGAGASQNSVAEADTDAASDPLFAAKANEANLPDGRYTLRLTATVAGTTRKQTRDLSFVLDSKAPSISVVSTSPGQVRLKITDASYLAAVQIGIRGANGTITPITDKTLYTNVDPAGGAWEVTLQTANLQASWAASGRSGSLPSVVTLTAWDYATNTATLDVGLPPAGQGAAETGRTSFVDVPATHPFVSDIAWLAGRGITTGYSDGTFRPSAPVTRAAFAAFLYRMAGSPAYTPPAVSPFKDVPATHQFYREISWAASVGITKGWSDRTFRPEAPITRDAIAAFLYRAAGSPSFKATKSFKDTANSEHRVAISWMASSAIAKGWSDGTFRPGALTERGAVAAFLHRFDAKGYKVKVR